MITLTKELALERLNRFKVIDPETNCWRTTGYTDPNGYGVITIEGYPYNVHRLSAYIFLDLDLNNKFQLSCHKEFCKHHDCWNPEHLYVGNHTSNVRDAIKCGTFNGYNGNKQKNKTHCKKGHKFTTENTYIRIRFGKSHRQCKECHRLVEERRRLNATNK